MIYYCILFIGVLVTSVSWWFQVFPTNQLYLATALISLLMGPLVYILSLLPLQQAANRSSKLMDTFYERAHLPLFLGFLFIFPLFSFSCYAFTSLQLAPWLFYFWLVSFTLYAAFFVNFLSLVIQHLSGSKLLDLYQQQAIQSLHSDNPYKVYSLLDILIETGSKGMEEGLQIESEEAVHSLMNFAKSYFAMQKTEALHTTNLDKLTDQQQYTSMYLAKGFSILFEKALKTGSHRVSGRVISNVGKLAIATEEVDPMLAKETLLLFDQFRAMTQNQQVPALDIQITCTLYEVLKEWIKDPSKLTPDRKNLLEVAINQLQSMSEEIFRCHKNMDLSVLIRPFSELHEKLKDQQGMQDLVLMLQNIIEDFNNLAQVVLMKSASKITNKEAADLTPEFEEPPQKKDLD